MTNFIQEVRAIEIVEDSFKRFKLCIDEIQQVVTSKFAIDINVFDMKEQIDLLNHEWKRFYFSTKELNYGIGRLSTKEIG